MGLIKSAVRRMQFKRAELGDGPFKSSDVPVATLNGVAVVSAGGSAVPGTALVEEDDRGQLRPHGDVESRLGHTICRSSCFLV